MTAAHWVLLVVGLLAGGALGFALGRLTAGTAAPNVAGKLEAAQAKADAARSEVDVELQQARDKAPSMGGRELEDALNEAFEKPSSVPAPAPLREPDSK